MSSDFSKRDADIILHMARYCSEIDAVLTAFGDSEAAFMQNPVFRNAVSMPVQQIGELAKHLSDGFIAAYPQMPWRQIKGMRDWFAHQYLDMDAAVGKGNIDLRLRNTLPYDVRLALQIAGGVLTVRVYRAS